MKSITLHIFLLFCTFNLVAQNPGDVPATYLMDENAMGSFSPADPSDGIQLIDPPTPNNLGTANLNFEIKIPEGRMGLSPDISINYSSSNAHTWLGHGWDLMMSAIEVETRWGVPRYNSQQETETYSLDGDMLYPVAHRDIVEDRKSDKVFYPRVEGDFMEIIRHGSSTKAYWWEITEKDGTKNFYGGNPTTGFDPSAVLMDDVGNIATWQVTMIEDVHGNNIIFEYEVALDSGIPSSQVLGREIYLSHIYYTGFNREKGKYHVRFMRDSELGEGLRPDVDIDANYGFKNVTADLLRKIEVYFESELLRSYSLEYTVGQFNKSLLESIAEYDNEDQLFYQHGFEYYNDLKDNNPYGSTENYNLPSDNLSGNIINPIPGFTGHTSALGGTESTSFVGGSAITVGPIGSLATKDISVGGSFFATNSSGEGIVTMVDLDGDGYSDKVFCQSNKMYYRKNLRNGNYGSRTLINGITQFSEFTSSGTIIGVEGHPPGGFVGYNDEKTKTNITTYFTDYNGDELIDIVQRGKVYFNFINEDGIPEFTRNSGITANPINTGFAIDGDLFDNDPDQQQQLENDFPLHDVVRMWKAPYDGEISIHAPVRLIENTSEERQEYTTADGVTVSIQAKNAVVWNASIGPDDYAVKTPTGLTRIEVRAGDQIYFRVQSRYDGAYDQVNWDPVITYHDQDVSTLDPTAKRSYQFQCSEDFITASCQMVKMPFTGLLRVEGNFSKPVTSDSIKVVVSQIINGLKLPIYTLNLAEHETYDGPIGLDSIAVIKDYEILFEVISDSNVEWSEINWNPRIYYLSTQSGMEVNDEDGNPAISFCPAPDYSMYNHVIQKGEPYIHQENGTVEVELGILRNLTVLSQAPATFTIKTIKGIVFKKDILITLPEYVEVFEVNLPLGDSLYFEVSIPDFEEGFSVSEGRITIKEDGPDTRVQPGLFTSIHEDDEIFGSLYRGWGHFTYNGNGLRGILPINESLLTLENSDIDDDFDYENVDTTNIDGAYNPVSSTFVLMFSDAKAEAWRGSDDLTFVTATTISSSRMGEDNILLSNQVSSGTGASAPNIIINNTLRAVAGGLSFGPASASGSKAWATSTNIIDFKDFNGDGYPDIVTGKSIQYTNPRGGLQENAINHNLGNHYAKSNATGFTLGGTFAHSSPTNSGGTAGAGSVRKTARRKSKTNKSTTKSKSSTRSSRGGVGISASFTDDNDQTEHSWLDMNGDGLPDKVYKGGDVALNYGYRFGPRENWGFEFIRKGVSIDYGGGVGVNVSSNSIAGGISSSRTEYHTTHAIQDVNGDGLVDIILSGEPMRVRFNNGNGFTSPQSWDGLTKMDEGSSTGESVNAAFTVCIPVPIIFTRFCVNPSTSFGRGVDRPLNEISDINNDGFPDILTSDDDGNLQVRKSNIGRTNLLRRINQPLGSVTTINYKPVVNDLQNPHPLWAFSELEVYDGVEGDGADYIRNEYTYEQGFFNRNERQFYGFEKVIDSQLNTEQNDEVARQVVYNFHNDNFYLKGKLKSVTQQDAEGNIYMVTEYLYALLEVLNGTILPPTYGSNNAGLAFPALVEEREIQYEGEPAPGISTSTQYEYDIKGNTTLTVYLGDGSEDQLLELHKTYYAQDEISRYDVVNTTDEYMIDGLARRMKQLIDDKGNVIQVDNTLEDGTIATSNIKYNTYGRITQLTRPENLKGERLEYTYIYDDVIHDKIVNTADNYGYSSRDSFDFRYDKLMARTDMNGHGINFQIDNRGRYTSITGPKEQLEDIPQTIRYEYFPDAEVAYAFTGYFNPGQENELEYYRFIDGIQREVQNKRSGIIQMNENAQAAPMMIVSGLSTYDCLGRMRSTHYPTTSPIGTKDRFVTDVDNVKPVVYQYDVLDRVTHISFPNSGENMISYSITSEVDNKKSFKTHVVDANGEMNDKYYDAMGREIANRWHGPDGDIWTTYTFNGVDELISSRDAEGNQTVYDYDWLGRNISIDHPDAGRTDLIFDLAGNIIKKTTENIRQTIPDGGGITYQYDKERLIQIDYPKHIFNRVQYHYGNPGDPFNRAGRIWLQEDASGGQEFFFDEYGQAEKIIRSVLINGANLETYVWENRFDTWGRIKEMIYPDAELVTYQYDEAGNTISVIGEKAGQKYTYIEEVGYDKFGQPTFMKYGNGVVTSHGYGSEDRRLRIMQTALGNETLASVNLDLNLEGHISQAAYSTTVPGRQGQLNSTLNYKYDPVYRIENISGSLSRNEDDMTYSMFLDYDDIHNIRTKAQTIENPQDSLGTKSWILDYQYDKARPHTASEIGGKFYTHDANGNVTGSSGNGIFRYTSMIWDEENRMMGRSADGDIMKVTYDASGERVVRSSGGIQGVFINGEPSGAIDHHNDFTANVSPYFVKNQHGFYKHYYLGGHRFLIKAGLGNFDNKFWPSGNIVAGNKNYIKRMQDLQGSVDNHYTALGVPPGPPTLQGYYGQPEQTGKPLPIAQLTSYNAPPRNWPQPTYNPDTTGAPGAPVWYTTDSLNNENVKAGFGFQPYRISTEIVSSYLHQDHVHSTILITDNNGEPQSSILYSPFGEILLEEKGEDRHMSSYRFNNKSYDEDSEEYFYGARYYDARTSLWNSVDPMAHKLPSWSPYAFSFHNPHTFIDDDGRLPNDRFSSKLAAVKDFGQVYNRISIFDNLEYHTYIEWEDSGNNGKRYFYNLITQGDDSGVNPGPEPANLAADVHTHSRFDPELGEGNNVFSPTDKSAYKKLKLKGYVITPDGSLKVYDPKAKKGRRVKILSRSMPYDKEHYTAGRPHRSAKKKRPKSTTNTRNLKAAKKNRKRPKPKKRRN